MSGILYPDYQHLWDTLVITDPTAVEQAAKLVLKGKETYEETVEGTKMPWEVVGCLHYRESGCDFTTHLHNGDSLKKRTVNVPAGRPLGEPPFTWQESAKDALFTLKKLDEIELWDIPTILKVMEKYNGVVYLRYHPNVLTPYLWACTSNYFKGKYASDGKFDPELKNKQVGTCPIYRMITDKTLDLV